MNAMGLNKSTKIWVNYGLGALISIFLLWQIYNQVHTQLLELDAGAWQSLASPLWLAAALLLWPLHMCLEAWKWQLLAGSTQPLSYRQALSSYLAGLACSLVTPNRIGEYPGRILYLRRRHTLRLISVSVMGACAQLLTILLFGIPGLIYYNIAHPGTWPQLALLAALILAAVLGVCYWRMDRWLPLLGRIKWLRRLKLYAGMFRRFSGQHQGAVLGISMLRFGVSLLQYLLLLRFMGIALPPLAGLCTAALFFWTLAVVPSISLAELGIRGKVSLFLFLPFTTNAIGILAATGLLWGLNLALPAIAGSLLMLRSRMIH